MTIEIREQRHFKDNQEIIIEYLNSHGLTDNEEINKIIDKLETKIANNESFAFFAYLNGKPVGLITGTTNWLVLEVRAFYVRKEAFTENCGFELIKAITEKAFNTNLKYFRMHIDIPYEMESSFEKNLQNSGFILIPRASMSLDLISKTNDEITLHNDYHFIPFALNDVDEIMNVMSKANSGDHPDLKIYPSMQDPSTVKKLFGGFTNNFNSLQANLNPQIKYNDKIVGMSIVVCPNPETAFIAEVSIDPAHQKKGLGKALMNKIILESKKNGCKKLGLAVTEENTGAFNLYKKLGFEVTSRNLTIVKHK